MASNALITRSSDIRQREFSLLVKLKASGRLVVRCCANVFPVGRTSCSGKCQFKCSGKARQFWVSLLAPWEAGKLHTKDVLPFLQGTCVGFLARQQKCPVLTNRKKGHIILTEEGRPMTPDGSQSNARRTLAFQQAEESQVESEDSREGAAGTSTCLHHQWDKHMATLPEIREILG